MANFSYGPKPMTDLFVTREITDAFKFAFVRGQSITNSPGQAQQRSAANMHKHHAGEDNAVLGHIGAEVELLSNLAGR